MAPSVRRTVVASGWVVAALCSLYVAALGIGLATLPAPDRPIARPWRASMELLILAIAPTSVVWSAAVHALSPPARRHLALAGVALVTACATLTTAVHVAILAVAERPEIASEPWAPRVFAFEWPSLVYAIDVLAWDLLFAIAMLLHAAALSGLPASRIARGLLLASGVLSLVGLLGVPLADMQVRNVGILGYAVLFPLAAAALAIGVTGDRSTVLASRN